MTEDHGEFTQAEPGVGTVKLSLKSLDARIAVLTDGPQVDVASLLDRVIALEQAVSGIELLRDEVAVLTKVAQSNSEEVTAALHKATEDFVDIYTPGDETFQGDLLIGILEALHSAGINTSARMANELEEKWLGDDAGDFMLARFPWLKDYR